MIINKKLNSIALIILLILAASCTNTKKAVYFRGQGDSTILSNNVVPETLIQSNDILSVLVNSLNPDASAIFNTTNNIIVSSTSAAGLSNQTSGYLVSSEGYIELPMLGKIKAEGLTKKVLQDIITKQLTDKKLLVDPIVNIRILNFKVTVLGEVEKPGVINVPSEKISLLEAFGLSGDLTINAQRDNILIIREEEGKKIIKRLNLNSRELFTSPYYYLKSNDVVYVEPNKTKIRNNSNSNLWVSIILGTLSFGVILLDHIN
jgi:polysaccharide export outer membrane protein